MASIAVPITAFRLKFTEYRQYTPGDDLRYLDWRVFARSDRYFIKKFEDETNLRCHLLVDNSRSMTYGSRGYTKAQYAATLAATLAYFLYLQGDAVGQQDHDAAFAPRSRRALRAGRDLVPGHRRVFQREHQMSQVAATWRRAGNHELLVEACSGRQRRPGGRESRRGLRRESRRIGLSCSRREP